LPDNNGQPENIATAVTEVTERVTVLIREEIELAKAEMTQKVQSIARGAAAIAAGAVFGVFAVVFVFFTLAWGLNSAFGSLWEGFAVVLVLLVAATIGAFVFAWRKLKVGAPTPQMALEEAKKIRATVSAKSEVES
jgi:uncharacterized small protein (DUF1192 family)